MITLKQLTLRNFLAYGNNDTVVNLDRPGATLIVGQNLDNPESSANSNGSGKSTILNAIVYALYGKPVAKVKKIDNLINHTNKKNMEVTLTFSVDGNEYKVSRGRKMKAGADGNAVHLLENGKDITRVPNSDTDADIERIIGMSYDMFIQVVVFTASGDQFFSMSGPQQKQFIEDLFQLSVLADRAEALKKINKDTKVDYDLRQQKVNQLLAENQRHSTLLEKAKIRVQQWEEDRTTQIDRLMTQLESVEGFDFDAEIAAHAEASKLQNELAVVEQAKTMHEREVRSLSQQLKKCKDDIQHLQGGNCPHCKQQYADSIKEAQKLQLELPNIQQQYDEAMVKSERSVASYTLVKDALAGAKQKITIQNLQKLLDTREKTSDIRKQIVQLNKSTNPHTEALQELESVVIEVPDTAELHTIERTMDHQNFLLKLLTKNDSFIRKGLIASNLAFLNKQLKARVAMLGLPMSVKFTDTLEAEITKQDNSIDPYLLSGGQGARVNFGVSVAFKDCRERLSQRTNVVFFDEVLDFGLDAPGITACAEMLRQMSMIDGTSIYVISHREEISHMFSKKLTIQMKDGFSTIAE